METKNLTATIENPSVVQAECHQALDELTAALTQVLKAVRKVHKAVEKLGVSEEAAHKA